MAISCPSFQASDRHFTLAAPDQANVDRRESAPFPHVDELAAAGFEHRLRWYRQGAFQSAGRYGDADAHAGPQFRNDMAMARRQSKCRSQGGPVVPPIDLILPRSTAPGMATTDNSAT